MENQAEMRTIIGGHHILTHTNWALSLVRKSGADHAYLILEGVDEEGRVCMDAHLVVKNNTDKKKAAIVLRGITVEQLKEVGAGCHSYTWQISKEQAEQLIDMVKKEKDRANRNEINYVLTGKTKLNTFFNASLTNDSEESAENHSRNLSVDALLINGHSCCSWAITMIQVLKLKTPEKFAPIFLCIPKKIAQGNHNADALAEEPTTQCCVM